MESSLRGHAAAFQQQQQIQMQNQQYQQQRRQRPGNRSTYSGGGASQPQDYKSVGSHFSRDSKGSAHSEASSQVDEAYRRLGQRLSVRAHGDGPPILPQRLSRIGLTHASSFLKFGERDVSKGINEEEPQDSSTTIKNGPSLDRTAKVAKTRYSDHGDHHHHKTPSRTGNVLRKMTMNAADLFRIWESDAAASASRRSKKRSSPKTGKSKRSHKSEKGGSAAPDLSPNRFAFSQLALDGSGMPQNSIQEHSGGDSHDQMPLNLIGGGLNPNGTGLSSVIESSSQTSSQSTTPNSQKWFEKSGDLYLGTSTNSGSNPSSLRTLPQGKCLTQPQNPVSNNGLDNVEGNLIVHENDAISVSRKQIHALKKEQMNVSRADFRIQGLLGQGTFAQVFQCVHVQTGNMVAIKVVKNKPAYTRQAAVEIDVFRVLVKGNPEKAPTSSKSQNLGSSPTRTSAVSDATVASQSNKWDHMVDLVCYFMHQNHLCLVFELLGLNLYEVLKKRQFRGLPLSVVRTLVKQALSGVKLLAKKNIVHCDLKPENILLVTEDDVDSVVSAGESRRRGSVKSGAGSLSSDKKTGSPQKGRQYSSSLDERLDIGEPPLTASVTDKIVHGNPIIADAISQSPANYLDTNGTMTTNGHSLAGQKIKLIDFGSACFEGQTAHTYIQSRFYRSPEVLVGLPYDSAIDMWSLGCVAAELFLGLPILPGVHEHDQLGRICEMISKPPDWMLEQGSKSTKYFVKYVPRDGTNVATPSPELQGDRSTPKMLPQWRIRSQQEYIASLSQSEIRKKGGLAKLEKQPGNRYFKRKTLAEIVAHKGQSGSTEDKNALDLFVHFLYGILDPDPWRRWTAAQATQHPFLVGGHVQHKRDRSLTPQGNKDENLANLLCDIYWEAPWDPNICRRKLLNVQKLREKQQASRRGFSGRNATPRPSSRSSHEGGADPTQESPRGVDRSPPKHAARQHGLGSIMANQALNVQLSASYTDYANGGNNNAGHLGTGTDASSVVSGPQLYTSGPLSYTDAGYSPGFFQNPFNEVDFAYALQRPGVVPMGESVSSSLDLSAAGLSQQQQQQQIAGSLGANSRNHIRIVQNRGSAMMSRSYGELGDISLDRDSGSLGFAPGSAGTVPGGLGQQISTSMQMASAFGQQPPGSLYEQVSTSFGQELRYGSTVAGLTGDLRGHQSNSMQSFGDPMLQSHRQQDSTTIANNLQNQLVYGNAQAYLQQQHAALRQQQLLLQQQQAALALQQEQLQVYGMNPGMVNGGQASFNQNASQLAGMNQFGQANGGYFYVTSADGTPMMVSAAGLAGQAGGYGLPSQAQNFGGAHSNGNGQQGAFDPRFYQQRGPNQY